MGIPKNEHGDEWLQESKNIPFQEKKYVVQRKSENKVQRNNMPFENR